MSDHAQLPLELQRELPATMDGLSVSTEAAAALATLSSEQRPADSNRGNPEALLAESLGTLTTARELRKQENLTLGPLKISASRALFE